MQFKNLLSGAHKMAGHSKWANIKHKKAKEDARIKAIAQSRREDDEWGDLDNDYNLLKGIVIRGPSTNIFIRSSTWGKLNCPRRKIAS